MWSTWFCQSVLTPCGAKRERRYLQGVERIGGPGRDRTDDLFHAIQPRLENTTTYKSQRTAFSVFVPATQVRITGKELRLAPSPTV
jgi:hypothetical protein